MDVTYIFHSGFVVETTRCVLVFDYWMDPAGVMRRTLATSKPIYVFSSHFHEDHFTREIFTWRTSHSDITYILSKDILKRRRAQRLDADVWMAKGATWSDHTIKVTATGSNDSGVSWIVEFDELHEGKQTMRRIFHAGDLCNWYARFLSDETAPQAIISHEEGIINPVAEEKRFLGELKDIRKVADTFDVAMFPVDGRIGNGYTLGARQFIERFRIHQFIPMHFVMSGFESAWRMAPYCEAFGIAFWSIHKEGECLPNV